MSTKIILLEGMDNYTIKEAMDITKSKLEKEGKSVLTVQFPLYDQRSGRLVKDHLKSFPEPNMSKKYDITTIRNNKNGVLTKDDLLFVKTENQMKITVVSEITVLYNNTIESLVLEDLISGEKYYYGINDKVELYLPIINNIFDWKANPSSQTKALLFTMDRNIWFANHLYDFNKYDVIIINRSHLANFLYRTVDMTTPEEFLEYVITIYNIEILANSLDKFDVQNLFVYTHNNILNYVRYKISDNLVSKDDALRDEQYFITISENFNHLKELIKATKEKYPDIFQRYSKYVEMNEFIPAANYKEEFDTVPSKISDHLVYRFNLL